MAPIEKPPRPPCLRVCFSPSQGPGVLSRLPVGLGETEFGSGHARVFVCENESNSTVNGSEPVGKLTHDKSPITLRVARSAVTGSHTT